MLKLKQNLALFCRSYSTKIISKDSEFKKKLISKFSKLNNIDHYEYLIGKNPKISQLNRASILVPISQDESNGKTYFTFMERTLDSRHYGGQICFMGGLKDANDRDEVDTALREAREESGIDPSHFTVLTKLSPLVITNVGRDSFVLTPVIAHLDNTNNLQVNLNRAEVEKLVEIDTEKFLSNDNYEMNAVTLGDDEFYFHYFERLVAANCDDLVSVWSVTALVAVIVSSILNARAPEFLLDPNVTKFDPNDPNKFLYEFVLVKSERIIDNFVKNKWLR